MSTLANAGYQVTLVVPDAPESVVDEVRLLAVRKPTARIQRLTRTWIDLWRVAARSDAAVVHVHDPDLLPIAVMCHLRGRLSVFDSHEDVPRQLGERSWIPAALRPWVAMLAAAIERVGVQFVDRVISAEPGAASRFPADRTTIVQNFPLASEFAVSDPTTYSERQNIVVYVGDITRARGAQVMVDAIGLLPADLDVQFVLAGRISESGLRRELELSPGWRGGRPTSG